MFKLALTSKLPSNRMSYYVGVDVMFSRRFGRLSTSLPSMYISMDVYVLEGLRMRALTIRAYPHKNSKSDRMLSSDHRRT